MSNLRTIPLVVAGFALAACQGHVSEPRLAAANVAPVVSGLARIYFYRDWEPYETLARPLIYLNDVPAEISEPGGISFRDVPAGEYYIRVDSQGTYPHQFKTIGLRAGDVRYVKIESLASWREDIGRRHLGQRDTFVVELIPEHQAQSEIGQMRYIPAS